MRVRVPAYKKNGNRFVQFPLKRYSFNCYFFVSILRAASSLYLLRASSAGYPK